MKRSIHLSGFDDDGQPLYRVTETKTINTFIAEVKHVDLVEVQAEVERFNEENSDLNLLKRSMKAHQDAINNSPDPAKAATDYLIKIGLLYPDESEKQYEEDGELIPWNKIKQLRASTES